MSVPHATERGRVAQRPVSILLALCLTAMAVLIVAPRSAHAATGLDITLLHGIPGVQVDVEINGSVAITDFDSGDSRTLNGFAGQTISSLRLLGAGTQTVVYDTSNITVPTSGSHTFVAHLDAIGAPTLTRFQNDVRPIAPGKGRLTIRHAAGVGPMDIFLSGVEIISNMGNAREGGADIEPGTYDLDAFSLDDGGAQVVGPVSIPVLDGKSLVVNIVGTGSDATVLLQAVTVMNSTAFCDGTPVTVYIGNGEEPTAGPDVILGTDGADRINGLGGDDVICGLGGNDLLIGGDGNDIIYGGDGIDRILGRDGIDFIYGEGGSDRIWGGFGDDLILGGSGADLILGGSGDDRIIGMGGQDRLYGDAGHDLIQGNSQSDKIWGGTGDDTLRGSTGKDSIYGGSGNDSLFGGDNSDTLRGESGDDLLHGQRGNDACNGGGQIADIRISC